MLLAMIFMNGSHIWVLEDIKQNLFCLMVLLLDQLFSLSFKEFDCNKDNLMVCDVKIFF
jgi:hypothetical protein